MADDLIGRDFGDMLITMTREQADAHDLRDPEIRKILADPDSYYVIHGNNPRVAKRWGDTDRVTVSQVLRVKKLTEDQVG